MHANSIPANESALMHTLAGKPANPNAISFKDGSIKEGGTNHDSSPSPTIQNRIDLLKSQAPPAPPDADTANMPVLTVKDLEAAWGQSDSIYDLDNDGTVNLNDLLKLLGEGGTIHHPDAPITVEGVRQAMETGNLAYDMDGDGNVNVEDLLKVLGGQVVADAQVVDTANMPVLTVKDLEAAWGQSDSIYDLDNDGTVNVNDLLKLLGEGGTIHHPDAPITIEGVRQAMETGNLAYDLDGDGNVNVEDLLKVLGGQVVADAQLVDTANTPMLTVDGLEAAWGQTDSVYDLDNDGTVNLNDLLKLLGEGGTIHHPDAPITIDGVTLAMQSGNLAYDLDGDGNVNVEDLLAALGNLHTNSNGNAPATNGHEKMEDKDAAARVAQAQSHRAETAPPFQRAEPITRSPGSIFDKPAPEPLPTPIAEPVQRERHEMQKLSETIFNRLLNAGFEKNPPANLHALLDRYDLTAPKRQDLLEKLSTHYPKGLGINRVG